MADRDGYGPHNELDGYGRKRIWEGRDVDGDSPLSGWALDGMRPCIANERPAEFATPRIRRRDAPNSIREEGIVRCHDASTALLLGSFVSASVQNKNQHPTFVSSLLSATKRSAAQRHHPSRLHASWNAQHRSSLLPADRPSRASHPRPCQADPTASREYSLVPGTPRSCPFEANIRPNQRIFSRAETTSARARARRCRKRLPLRRRRWFGTGDTDGRAWTMLGGTVRKKRSTDDDVVKRT